MNDSLGNLQVFGPYLFFLISSVYIKGQMAKWNSDEEQMSFDARQSRKHSAVMNSGNAFIRSY